MTDISVSNLIKSFSIGDNILNGFSFEVLEGEHIGIMGKNGAGKSTLFKILTGELYPDEGDVFIAPGKKLGLISQIPVYPEDYRVEDVLRTAFSELFALSEKMKRLEKEMENSDDKSLLRDYDALSLRFSLGGGYDMDLETDKICHGLGIPPEMRHQLFDSLSGGEKTRVNLGRLLLQKTDILLLDEPTNHLDMHSVEWLEDYILKFKGTVLTISHDRWFLDRTVKRIVEIHEGKAEFYSGNYSFYMEEKQARFNLQMKQYEQEQAKLKQLGFTLERMKGWGINNRTLYRRAMSIQHRMDRIQKTGRPKKEKSMRASFRSEDFFGDEVFSVKNLGMSYGDRILFENVELLVKGGERIALLGDNGTGKTSFLKLLLGEESGEGKVRFGPTVKWAYLPQNISFEHPERTLYDTMLYEQDCSPQSARDRLGRFMFEGEDVFKTVGTLSGGEKARLRLCMLMEDKINLLILDEPTNHLDIASREWVEAAIEEYEGTLLFVSHDRYFVNEFAERIWELQDGTIRDFPFGYEKYCSVKEHEKLNAQRVPQSDKNEKKVKKEKISGGTKELEKKVRRLEREIQAKEDEIAALEKELEEAAADYQLYAEILAKKETEDAALSALLEEWEEAASQLEEG